jgi:hypothetical protein
VAQEKPGQAAARQHSSRQHSSVASNEQQSLKDAERSQKIAQNLEALQKTQTDIRTKNIAKLRETLGLNEAGGLKGAKASEETTLVGGQSEFNIAVSQNSHHRESFSSSQPRFVKLGQIIDIKV